KKSWSSHGWKKKSKPFASLRRCSRKKQKKPLLSRRSRHSRPPRHNSRFVSPRLQWLRLRRRHGRRAVGRMPPSAGPKSKVGAFWIQAQGPSLGSCFWRRGDLWRQHVMFFVRPSHGGCTLAAYTEISEQHLRKLLHHLVVVFGK